jgi:hypothetical protein
MAKSNLARWTKKHLLGLLRHDWAVGGRSLLHPLL